MSDRVTTEAARLAMALVRTEDERDNHRALMVAMRSFEDPMDRLSVHFHAARLLALQLRELTKAIGTFDRMIEHIDAALFDLVMNEEEP